MSVVTVPENVETAQNHGVLVGSTAFGGSRNESVSISLAQGYLQKPSIHEMEAADAFLAQDIEDPVTNFAMIDTGVVLAAGTAFTALLHLVNHEAVYACTAGSYYKKCREIDNAEKESKSLRLELFSEILHATSKQQKSCSFEDYLLRVAVSLPMSVKESHLSAEDYCLQEEAAEPYLKSLVVIWQHLRNIPLYMIGFNQGIFIHLGTLSEFLDFVCFDRDYAKDGPQDSPFAVKVSHFLRDHTLHESLGCALINEAFTTPSVQSDVHRRYRRISINSIIYGELGSISKHSFIEHSVLLGNFAIGRRSMVSHIDGALGKDLIVRDNVMIQRVFLQSREAIRSNHKVTIVLGVDDDVKASYKSKRVTICGYPWQHMLDVTGINSEDIWCNGLQAEEQNLWNAQLFPVYYTEATASGVTKYRFIDLSSSGAAGDPSTALDEVTGRFVMTWWQDLSNTGDIGIYVDHWKRFKRLSLAQILAAGHPGKMFSWRRFMEVSVQHANSNASIGSDSTVKLLNSISDTCNSAVDCFNDLPTLASDASGDIDHSCHCDGLGYGVAASILLALWCCNLSQSAEVLKSRTAIRSSITQIIPTFNNNESKSSNAYLDKILAVFDNMFSFVNTTLRGDAMLIAIKYLKALAEEASVHQSLSIMKNILLPFIDHSPCQSYPRFFFLAAFFVSASDQEMTASNGLSDTFDELLETMKMVVLSYLRAVDVDKIAHTDVININQSLSLVGKDLADKVIDLVSILLNRQSGCSKVQLRSLALFFEEVAQQLVNIHVQVSSLSNLYGDETLSDQLANTAPSTILRGKAAVARAPVRIDVAGGWSDTPPVCYEANGSVLNVAIAVDGRLPMQCVARMIREPCIILRPLHAVYRDDPSQPRCLFGEKVEVNSYVDFNDVSDPLQPASLLKAALIVFNIGKTPSGCEVPAEESFKENLFNRFGGGIEIATVSDLPAGSGLGGSSILAATVLTSLSHLLGVHLTRETLVNLVSSVEQIMTTGGGWQDQIGAIFGGFKIGRSENKLPLNVTVESLHLIDPSVSAAFQLAFESRTFLVYTGKQRLAKNTLINALRRYAITPLSNRLRSDDSPGSDESLDDNVIARLVQGAENCFQSLAVLAKDDPERAVDKLAVTINQYWALKKIMAAGSEPRHIRKLLDHLKPLCAGQSLCGAGGGGFAVVILNQGVDPSVFATELADYNMLRKSSSALTGSSNDQLGDLTLHSVTLNSSGIEVHDIDDSNESIDEYFHLDKQSIQN